MEQLSNTALSREEKFEVLKKLLAKKQAPTKHVPIIAKVNLGSEQGSPLSYVQHRLWLLDQIDGGNHYNIPVGLRLTGTLNYSALKNAFITVINRHECLRTYFTKDNDGQPIQVIQDGLGFNVEFIDISVKDCLFQM